MNEPEIIESEELVHEYLGTSAEVVGVSLVATLGMGDPLMPPVMYVARAPGFDFSGLPGGEGVKASANDYRWGVLNNEGDLWATLELWWPGDIERRLKVNLQQSSRNLFPMLAEIAPPSRIVTLGISDEKGGIPDRLLGVEVDINDQMFRSIASWVHHLKQGGDR